jgi:hypothetical protein
MRIFTLAVLVSSSLFGLAAPAAFAETPVQLAATNDGQAEFVAAGTDVAKLKDVAAKFPDTVWGKLAAAHHSGSR